MLRPSDRDTDRSDGTLAIAIAGALAGVAVGLLLADRFGGIGGIRRRLRAAFAGDDHHAPLHERRSVAPETYADDPLDEDEYELGADDFEEDDFEEDTSDADAQLEARVLAAFERDAVLRERAVDISAIDGSVIELSGWVQTRSERTRAGDLARGVEGVGTVANSLFVGDPDTKDTVDLSTR